MDTSKDTGAHKNSSFLVVLTIIMMLLLIPFLVWVVFTLININAEISTLKNSLSQVTKQVESMGQAATTQNITPTPAQSDALNVAVDDFGATRSAQDPLTTPFLEKSTNDFAYVSIGEAYQKREDQVKYLLKKRDGNWSIIYKGTSSKVPDSIIKDENVPEEFSFLQ